MKKILAIILFSLALLPLAAFAASSKCPQHYWGGEAPDFLNQKLSAKTMEVCYEGFGVIHSGITRTPLAVGEHLTRERLSGPRPSRRDDTFRPDPNIPASDRAELQDYEGSGYDRGHMAPSGDMPDERSQQESFSLANVVPQNGDNNRNLWEKIETAVREYTKESGEVYVVTGPVFYGSELKRIGGRVLVPTYIFKAVYDPKRNEGAAYLVENEPGARYALISITDLDRFSGLAVFPKLPDSVRQKKLRLPAPQMRKNPAVEDLDLLPVR